MHNRRLIRSALLTVVATLTAATLGDCSAKKVYPDPDIGWHNANYSVVFGRLARIAPRNPEDPPVWTVRFGTARDLYTGELALTPPERLTGYSGGEMVEIRGTPRPELAHPDYSGMWYEIRGIRLWSPKR